MRAQALKGFRDYLPEEMIAKERMLDAVRKVFESFGYPPIQTPALEYSELLLGKYGEEGEMLMYRFRDHGERDICLRYDLTVPLARVVAEHGHRMSMPFRRYQIAPVWRAEKPAKGRFREFLQCDVDLIGVDSPEADAEMVLVDSAVLEALGVSRFQVRVNHRGVLRAWTRSLEITAAREGEFLRLLDKLPKIGEEKLGGVLRDDFRIAPSAIERLLESTRPATDPRETLERLRQGIGGDPHGDAALERLTEVVEQVAAAGDLRRISIDPRIARGLSYYTGIVYETTLDELPDFGSVMSGGRYDELLGMFCKKKIPAVGISLGVDRLFSALKELRKTATFRSPARVMVVNFGDAGSCREAALAAQLRAAGIPTLLYPAAVKLKKQFQYCHQMQIPYAVAMGKDEAERGTVSLKEMSSGTQRELSVEDVIREINAGMVPGDERSSRDE